jgi:hypothetical protein
MSGGYERRVRIGVVLGLVRLLAWPAAAWAQLDLTRVTALPELGGRSAMADSVKTSRDGGRQVFSAVRADGTRGFFERAGDATRLLFALPADRFMHSYDASDDALTVLVGGTARLVPEDADDLDDLYLVRDGQPVLLTPGSDTQPDPYHPGGLNSDSTTTGGLSRDGARAIFSSPLRLSAADGDDAEDVYVWEAGTFTLASPGVEGTSVALMRHSADGRTVVYSTTARVTGDDTDDVHDLYAVTGGQTRKLSPGNGPYFAELSDLSADGGAVLFATQEGLVSGDQDGAFDLYRLGPDGPARVTAGPTGGEQDPHRKWRGFFMDGAGQRVAFISNEPLTGDDADTITDVYVWESGAVRRVSHGPSGGNAQQVTYPNGEARPAPASLTLYVSDGEGVYFQTQEALTADDGDGFLPDLYEHRAGQTRLVSTGPGGDPDAPCRDTHLLGCEAHVTFVSRDGRRVVFGTEARLVAEDTDETSDVYQRSGGVTTLLSPARPDVPLHRHVNPRGGSDDGSVVFLTTEEALTADDQDRQGADVFRVRPPSPGVVVPGLGGAGPDAPVAGVPVAGVPAVGDRLRLLNRPRRVRMVRGRSRMASGGSGLRLHAPRRVRVTVQLLAGGRVRAQLRLVAPAGRSTLVVGQRLPRRRWLRPGRYVLRLRGGGETLRLPVRLLAPRRR